IKRLDDQAGRLFRPLAVSGIYLVCFVGLHALSAGLQVFPEIGPWNLSAGLSLWLLDFGFGYIPVVIAAHVLAMVWPMHTGLTGWQMMMFASAAGGVYTFGSVAMRQLSTQSRIDLFH